MSYHDFIQRYRVFLRLKKSGSQLGLSYALSPGKQGKSERCQGPDVEIFYEKVKSHLSSHDGQLRHNEHKKLRRRSGKICV